VCNTPLGIALWTQLMAKKKSAATATQASNGASTTNSLPDAPNKVQAVHAQLDKGVESPTQIVGILKGQGIDITPNYVSLIKGEYLRGGKKKKRAGRAKKATAPLAAAPAARVTPKAAGLSPQDLADLGSMMERAGGGVNLRAYLDVLEKLK
jgi:hypothetical protein